LTTEDSRIAELRRRVENDPSSIAFAQLAEEYRRAGNFEAAENACRAGLERHPAYASARVTLGRTLIQLGRTEEGQQELEHALTLAPDNLAAIRALADVHRQQGDFKRALEYFQRAAPLARHNPELLEIVEQLRRQVQPRSAPAVPTDLDAVLRSMGFAERGAPPAVEALLAISPGEQRSAVSQSPKQSATGASRLSDEDLRVLRELEAWLAVLTAEGIRC
jgi:tetratricopeptide (TPR) repeat protein